MALINCSNCGCQMSDKAKNCPKCGYTCIDFVKHQEEVAKSKSNVGIESLHTESSNRTVMPTEDQTKYCKYCGAVILKDAVICTKCGRQIEEVKKYGNEQIIINNSSNASASTTAMGGYGCGRAKNKWVALLLCIFTICGHKFYEGKIGMGILYIFTAGLFGIGWVIDIITLICRPNPYFAYY